MSTSLKQLRPDSVYWLWVLWQQEHVHNYLSLSPSAITSSYPSYLRNHLQPQRKYQSSTCNMGSWHRILRLEVKAHVQSHFLYMAVHTHTITKVTNCIHGKALVARLPRHAMNTLTYFLVVMDTDVTSPCPAVGSTKCCRSKVYPLQTRLEECTVKTSSEHIVCDIKSITFVSYKTVL